jgi:periplasmic protein TonB
MFDLVSGTIDRPFCDRHVVPTVFSVVAHVVLVGGAIAAALFVITEQLPRVPTMMSFVAAMPAPPPAPPPAPASRPQPVTAQLPKPIPTSGQLTLPVVVPTVIAPETGIETGVLGGVPGGVEGGIQGGVPGGIVGGLMTAVPPPPQPVSVPRSRAPVQIGGLIQAPALVQRVEPIYPDIAVKANVTGVVILEATVNERGEVIGVVVLRSRKLLDQAAIDAVRQWRYSPLLLNDEARPFVLTVTLNFSIQ